MWDLPGPGIEPVPPALADGFLNTAPPGKSLEADFRMKPWMVAEKMGWGRDRRDGMSKAS